MRFLTPLLLSAAGLPIATWAQNAQYLVQALHSLQTQTQYLDSMVAGFSGVPLAGTFDIISIQTQSDQVGRAIQAATWSAEAIPSPLDAHGSETVAAAVLALRPITEQLLHRIQFKKPTFDQVFLGILSVSKQIQQSLEDQKALTKALSHAIAEKLSGAYRVAAPQITQEFEDAFDEAIGAYVVADGIQVPALPIPPLVPKKRDESEVAASTEAQA